MNPSAALSAPVLFLGLANLGAFFAYEVCRKLDPDAHPILKTYLSVYGPGRTFALVLAACALAAFGAFQVGLGTLLWPFEGLLLASFALTIVAPAAQGAAKSPLRRHKLVEGVASVSLLAHLWGPVLVMIPLLLRNLK